MRHVTFATAVTPYNRGDKRVVPDAVADRLQAEGVLSANEPFGTPSASAPAKPVRQILKPARPAGVADSRMAK